MQMCLFDLTYGLLTNFSSLVSSYSGSRSEEHLAPSTCQVLKTTLTFSRFPTLFMHQREAQKYFLFNFKMDITLPSDSAIQHSKLKTLFPIMLYIFCLPCSPRPRLILLTYPHNVPRMRFIIKKAPIRTRVTKYTHGHDALWVSFI